MRNMNIKHLWWSRGRQGRTPFLLALLSACLVLILAVGCGGGKGSASGKATGRQQGTVSLTIRLPETDTTGRKIPDGTKLIRVALLTEDNALIDSNDIPVSGNPSTVTATFNNIVKDTIVATATTYTSEDKNNNGVLNSGEDTNNNGVLDTNVATGFATTTFDFRTTGTATLTIKPVGSSDFEIRRVTVTTNGSTMTVAASNATQVRVGDDIIYQLVVKDAAGDPVRANELQKTFAVSIANGTEAVSIVHKPFGSAGANDFVITQPEDTNGDGVLQNGEDVNKNGILDEPGLFKVHINQSASITIAPTYSEPGASPTIPTLQLESEALIDSIATNIIDFQTVSGVKQLLQAGTATVTVTAMGYVPTRDKPQVAWTYERHTGPGPNDFAAPAPISPAAAGTDHVVNNKTFANFKISSDGLSVTMTGGRVGSTDQNYRLNFVYAGNGMGTPAIQTGLAIGAQPEEVTVSRLKVTITGNGLPVPPNPKVVKQLKAYETFDLNATVTGVKSGGTNRDVQWYSDSPFLNAVNLTTGQVTGPNQVGTFTVTAKSVWDTDQTDTQQFQVMSGTVNGTIK